MTAIDLRAILPELILAAGGLVVLLVAVIWPKASRGLQGTVSLVTVLLAFGFVPSLWGENLSGFGGLVAADNYALVFGVIFLISAALTILLSLNRHETGYILYDEFFALVLFAAFGMMLMAAGTDLLTIFIGLETLSISLYVLAAFRRNDPKALESAFKYFLLGAFASAFLLYGIALMYGVSGSTRIVVLADFVLNEGFLSDPLFVIGFILALVGFGFKVAVVPFHMWTPDVYQGAPTPVTAFMATGSKAAGFAALLRVLGTAFGDHAVHWQTAVWVLAVLTMTIGNITALRQQNIKRMLAYSSIAHAGYVLVGIIAANEMATSSAVFYLLAYTFMTAGAFGVVSMLASQKEEFVELSAYRGLAYNAPTVALVMSVFMFSLAGIPPTAGFMGKFYLFSAAVKAGFIWLVIFGVINSMISLYYYLGVVVNMFMSEAEATTPVPVRVPAVAVALGIAVFGTLALGLFPSQWMDLLVQLWGTAM
jgi:NADH-quinone oxidoreductase subunit N